MRSIEDQLILHEGLKLKPYRCFGVTYEGLKRGMRHLTLNQGVRGSSPRWGTNQKYAKPRKYGVFAFSGLTQGHEKIRRKHTEFVVVIYT